MNTQNTVVTPITPNLDLDASVSPVAVGTSALVLGGDSMDKMLKFAEMMATSRITIPKHLQGNSGDCFAIVMQSMQWGMNPFAVAQKTHLVNGVLGYEAQLVNAVINARAPITTRLNYEWFGDWSKINGKTSNDADVGVIVSATLRGENEPRTLSISMAQVGAVRNSPLWVADPRQQIAYLATKRWSRLHCPDVILGVNTTDELEDYAPRDVTPASEKPTTTKTSSVRDKVAARKQEKPPVVVDGQSQEKPQSKYSLNQVIEAIDGCLREDALVELGGLIAGFGLSDDDRRKAGEAYKSKMEKLKSLADFDAGLNGEAG